MPDYVAAACATTPGVGVAVTVAVGLLAIAVVEIVTRRR